MFVVLLRLLSLLFYVYCACYCLFWCLFAWEVCLLRFVIWLLGCCLVVFCWWFCVCVVWFTDGLLDDALFSLLRIVAAWFV